MKNLIIDAATDKILFKIIAEKESYTSEITSDRENFDKFVQLLFNFLIPTLSFFFELDYF